MKLKYILLITFLGLVALIIYFYKRAKSSSGLVSLSAELDVKCRKLAILSFQLSTAKAKKACLDQVVARKAALITCSLVFFCMSTSLIYDSYSTIRFARLYLVIAWCLLTLFSTLYYHKVPSWATVMEVITSKIRIREYRKGNFDSDSFVVLSRKVMTLTEETNELKEKQITILSQNTCEYL